MMGESATEAGVTTEHLKSHLQKYRLNYGRSKAEFLEMYDQSLKDSKLRHDDSKVPELDTLLHYRYIAGFLIIHIRIQ